MPGVRAKNVWEALAGGQSHQVTNPTTPGKAASGLQPTRAPVAPGKIRDKHERFTLAARSSSPSVAQKATLAASGVTTRGSGTPHVMSAGGGGVAILDPRGNQLLLAQSSGITQGVGSVLQGSVGTPLAPPGAASIQVDPSNYSQSGSPVNGLGQLFVAWTWYDNTNETPVGPTATVTVAGTNNAVNVVTPPAPKTGLFLRIYVDTITFGPGTANPTGGHLQATLAASVTTTNAFVLTHYQSTTAAPPGSSGFTNTSAYIRPGAPVDSNGAPYSWTLEGDGRIRFLGPTLNDQFWVYDDFLYPGAAYPASTVNGFLGTWEAQSSGTAAVVQAGTSTSVNPGVVQCNTGTTAAGFAIVRTGTWITTGAARLRFSVYAMIDTISDGTNTFTAAMGLNSGIIGTTAYTYCVLFMVGTGGANNISLLTNSNGAIATATAAQDLAGSTVPWSAGAYHFLEFEINPAGTSINWWVDAVAQAPVAFNGGISMALQSYIIKTAGTSARTLNVDTMALYGDYVS